MTDKATTATCQCTRASKPCARPITQEDLLCDVCGGRDPDGFRCGSIVGLGADDDRHHIGLRIDWGRYHAGQLGHDEVMQAIREAAPELNL